MPQAQTVSTGSNAATGQGGKTIVYLVRHAEKSTENPQDPALSAEGQKRADDLLQRLVKEPVQALYATKYKRTQQTLQPLAQAKSLPVQIYEASDFAGLAQRIKDNHQGQTVVVAGHSNTVLPILEAFGVKKPIQQIEDHQYDLLFIATLQEGEVIDLVMTSFGAPSSKATNN
ncbi:SixA phosphatase family protein [Rufibacter roseus]|uniref:SixA phosphatase family protein n=1 Tax=Rufibacter roseus TaxID=1567108 RepID=A0ABW2DLH8_9BACT|nr:phosphoglycerate mutase family protein [Rufibacter roseus]